MQMLGVRRKSIAIRHLGNLSPMQASTLADARFLPKTRTVSSVSSATFAKFGVLKADRSCERWRRSDRTSKLTVCLSNGDGDDFIDPRGLLPEM
jgi:hypothetical protein